MSLHVFSLEGQRALVTGGGTGGSQKHWWKLVRMWFLQVEEKLFY